MDACCLKCGRVLRAASSILRGYGRACWTHVRRAAQSAARLGIAPETAARALELISERAVVQARRTVFMVVSSDGARVYRTAPQGCTCPAGVKGIPCYHRAAASLLLAA